MTVLAATTYTCPICSTEVPTQIVRSTNSFGGKRTDFHERAAGTQPLPYLVHCCAGCGFAGEDDDFRDPDATLDATFLRARLTALVAGQAAPTTAAERYERAVMVGELLDLDGRRLAERWLRAAWCAVDDGDREAERFYRLRAVRAYEALLERWDGVPRPERPVFLYLVGELWRRIGDRRRAAAWFDRVEAEVTDRQEHGWVIDAARQQRDCPREWFG